MMISLFAGLSVLNLGITRSADETNVSLDTISVMAKALELELVPYQEIGGEGTCGYRVYSDYYGQYFIECGVNLETAQHMMGLCHIGFYTDCNWCCDSCGSSSYCSGS